MTLDTPTATELAGQTMCHDLVMLDWDRGRRIEMTLDNQMQLEREMAGTFDNPLAALMAQVAIEMAATGGRGATCR